MVRYDYPRMDKQPDEEEVFDIYFDRVIASDPLASVVSLAFTPVTSPVLTVGTPTVHGDKTVRVAISGGLTGTVYTGKVVAETQSGRVVEGDVKLYVKEL